MKALARGSYEAELGTKFPMIWGVSQQRAAAFAIVAVCFGCAAAPARADFGDPAQTRDVRDALLRTWTAFGRDPDLVAKAVAIPDVTISGGYALCTFRSGAQGGQMLLQQQRGIWVKLFQTGGIMSSVDLKAIVPAATAAELARRNQETSANDAFLIGRR